MVGIEAKYLEETYQSLHFFFLSASSVASSSASSCLFFSSSAARAARISAAVMAASWAFCFDSAVDSSTTLTLFPERTLTAFMTDPIPTPRVDQTSSPKVALIITTLSPWKILPVLAAFPPGMTSATYTSPRSSSSKTIPRGLLTSATRSLAPGLRSALDCLRSSSSSLRDILIGSTDVEVCKERPKVAAGEINAFTAKVLQSPARA
mmetsp:Transcript_24092/g.35009  ORF Transcript_24092/g.35009 Transcript_24092/m.35009 type:complete len:207 (-) Transcript_24092:98-718(-)